MAQYSFFTLFRNIFCFSVSSPCLAPNYPLYFPDAAAFFAAAGGSGWIHKDGWLDDSVFVCDWFGITCDPNFLSANPSNASNVIIRLLLPVNNVKGILSDVWNTLISLVNLHELDFCDNIVSGDLTFLSQTPSTPHVGMHLTSLALCQNSLSGSIPDISPYFPNLQWLDLSNNQLQDQIPDFNLPQFTNLYLYSNNLRSTLPSFSLLPNLWELDLHSNFLTGSIPSWNFQSLTLLDLSQNALYGPIPSFSSLPILSFLYLHSNQLTFELSRLSLPQLLRLRLGSNRITQFEADLNLPSLTLLDLCNNPSLHGSLRPFGNLTLAYFDIHNTWLEGDVSLFLLNSASLLYLDISSTRLSGSLRPLCISSPSLQHLDVHNTSVQDVTSCFQNPSLSFLRASMSNITLPSSLSFCGLSSPLVDLDLSGNPFLLSEVPGSYFPRSCFANYSLVRVNLSSVNLSHRALHTINALPFSVSVVDLSGNPSMDCYFVPAYEDSYLRNYNALSVLNIRNCDGTLGSDFPDGMLQDLASRFVNVAYPSSVFTLRPQQLVFDVDTGLSCTALQFASEGLTQSRAIQVIVSPSFNYYVSCSCEDVDAFWNSQMSRCVKCSSSNVICEGDPLRNWSRVTVKSGFYPIDLQSKAFDPSFAIHLPANAPSTVLFPCSSRSVCNPAVDASADYVCGFGYDRDSLLCSGCLQGYFSYQGRCVVCTDSVTGFGRFHFALFIISLLMALWFGSGHPHALAHRGSSSAADREDAPPSSASSSSSAPRASEWQAEKNVPHGLRHVNVSIQIALLWVQTMTALRTVAFSRQMTERDSVCATPGFSYSVAVSRIVDLFARWFVLLFSRPPATFFSIRFFRCCHFNHGDTLAGKMIPAI